MKALSRAVSVAAVLAFCGVARAADPTSVPAPSFKVGDSWLLEKTVQKGPTGFSRIRQEVSIDRLDSDSMVIGLKLEGASVAPEEHVAGLDWALKLNINGEQKTTAQPLSFPLEIGKTWTADWTDPRHVGAQLSAHFHRTYKVVGWEDVTVPAGTFHALKVEETGSADGEMLVPSIAQSAAVAEPGSGATVSSVRQGGRGVLHIATYAIIDYAPEVKRAVKTVDEEYDMSDVMTERVTEELVSFKPGS